MANSFRDVTLGSLLTRLADEVPDRPALLYHPGPRYTFAALEKEARAIARGLIEAHGGTMGVESDPGHGSRFRFTLKLA